MIRNEKLKLLGIPLLGALLIYFGGYFGIEHLRHRKGPWQVEFLATTNNTPAVRVTQPVLGLSNVLLVLEGEPMAESSTNSVMQFVEPLDTPFAVPQGRVIFEDLTFLPGTVTFDFNGHGVELLPRTLILNGREHPWKSGETIRLKPEDKSHPITPAEYKERTKVLKDKS